MRGKLFVIAALWALACSTASAVTIDRVDVRLNSAGSPVPTLAAKRISASIQTVGRRVLLEHDDGEVAQNVEAYKKIMNDIVDRVLIGYTVETIVIEPGSDTIVDVTVRPWGDTIENVDMTVDFGSLPVMAQELAKKTSKVHRG